MYMDQHLELLVGKMKHIFTANVHEESSNHYFYGLQVDISVAENCLSTIPLGKLRFSDVSYHCSFTVLMCFFSRSYDRVCK